MKKQNNIKTVIQDIENIATMLPHNGPNDPWPLATAITIVGLTGTIKMSVPQIMQQLQNIETMLPSTGNDRQGVWDSAIQILKLQYHVQLKRHHSIMI